jgi:hypothetical protein
MLANAATLPAAVTASRTWFTLLLNNASATIADKHVPMYLAKGLLRRYETLVEVARALNVDLAVVQATLTQYVADAKAG